MKRITMLISLVTFIAASAVAEVNPYAKADNTWITISGKVTNVTDNSFRLDYGDGEVTVEMDDWDPDPDGYKLFKGDEVTVNGIVDDDMFETTTIEASSVYVQNIHSYFYANPDDEEDASVPITSPVLMTTTIVQGKVTSIDGHNFTIDSGNREITVDTSTLGYNPLDDKGIHQIDVGDRVSVTGTPDPGFFGNQELNAEFIVTIKG